MTKDMKWSICLLVGWCSLRLLVGVFGLQIWTNDQPSLSSKISDVIFVFEMMRKGIMDVLGSLNVQIIFEKWSRA